MRFGQKKVKRGVADARQLAAESPKLPKNPRLLPVVPLVKPAVRPSTPRRRIPDEAMDWSRFDDSRRMGVMLAERHQPVLLRATGGLMKLDTDRVETLATLQREPTNTYDAHAVAVMFEGQRVGYLKSGSAKRLNARVGELDGSGERYPMLIRLAEPGLLAAILMVPYSSKLLAGYKNRKRKRSR